VAEPKDAGPRKSTQTAAMQMYFEDGIVTSGCLTLWHVLAAVHDNWPITVPVQRLLLVPLYPNRVRCQCRSEHCAIGQGYGFEHRLHLLAVINYDAVNHGGA